MVTRWLVFVLVGALLVACYSGLTSLEPFPCANDGKCPNGLLCNKDKQCTCPLQCGQTCVDPQTDSSNCGGCNNACSTVCAAGACQNLCTLFGTDCPTGKKCVVEVSSTAPQWGTVCQSKGSATIGQPCTHGNDCIDGLVCLLTNNVGWCWKLCDDNHTCPGGSTCISNANIPANGGYCETSSACGQSNFTLPCTGPAGSYTCPANSTCSPTTTNPKQCSCNAGFTALTCQNGSCSNGCSSPNWWCD
jgi:hypothetical protein